MSVLGYFFKTKFVVASFLLVLISCRKEIQHTEGITTEIIKDSGGETPTTGWIKVSGDGMTEFHSLQVFNNELYVGGAFEDTTNNFSFLGKLDANGNVVRALSQNFIGNGIYDLEVFNNELIIGGNFFYGSLNTNADLIRMNASGTITDIPFSNSSGSTVRCIFPSNSDLYIGGKFSASSSNSIISSNIEKLVNYTPVGMANLSNEVYAISKINTAILVCGPSIGVKNWNGSNWSAFSYPNFSNFDEIYSMSSGMSEFYLLGNFSYGLYTLKMKDTFGNWFNVDEVKHTGKLSNYTKVKEIGQDLFLFGKGFSINGGPVSSIVKLSGSDWYVFSDLQYEVRDMVFFNGYYYIATNYGLFKYK